MIGCGYLGAVHAACMADLGHEVVGVDVDQAKVETLAAGRAPFFEPGLPELLTSALATGRLAFGTDIEAARGATVHFVAVGTPQRPDGYAADLTFVDAAFAALLPVLAPGDLVVGKSTVPVGTAARLAELVEGVGARLAWNPEFLREGFAVRDTLSPDRLVYGVRAGDEASAAALDEVYATAIAGGTPRVVTDFATAELVKVAANAFLATKISFINAMAEVAEATGADVTQPGGRDRLRPADRPALPQRGTRVRRRLPAQGHPRLHGARRGARRRPGARIPARGRRDQPAPSWAHGGPRDRGVRRERRGQAHRGARPRLQARLRRRARFAGARRRGAARRPRRRGRRDRPARRSRPRGACGPPCATSRPPRRRPRARMPCCC